MIKARIKPHIGVLGRAWTGGSGIRISRSQPLFLQTPLRSTNPSSLGTCESHPARLPLPALTAVLTASMGAQQLLLAPAECPESGSPLVHMPALTLNTFTPVISYACSYTCTHTCKLTHLLSHLYTPAHIHIFKLTHLHMLTYAYPHTCSHTFILVSHRHTHSVRTPALTHNLFSYLQICTLVLTPSHPHTRIPTRISSLWAPAFIPFVRHAAHPCSLPGPWSYPLFCPAGPCELTSQLALLARQGCGLKVHVELAWCVGLGAVTVPARPLFSLLPPW